MPEDQLDADDGGAAYVQLFDPISLGPIKLKNRIVMLPHTTLFTEEGHPSSRHHDYYLERARGGVGLVIVETMNVQENGGVGGVVNAFDREAMLGWRDTVVDVHAEGTKIFGQLTHCGVEASPADTMLPLWAPSAVPSAVTREIPKAMDAADMAAVKDGFVRSAANAVEAGFDGVELKVGHDGLLRLFLSPYFNHREDEYGGSPENRVRYVLETIEAVRAEIGPNVALGARLSLDEGYPGGYGLEEGLEFAALIGACEGLDYMTSDMGTWQGFPLFAAPMNLEQGYADEATAAMKVACKLPLIAFGRIKRPGHAARILAEDTADLIGMTRQLLADPEWANKVREGRIEEIRPCVACNQECIGRVVQSLPIACVHNPAAGREAMLGVATRTTAETPKRVIVVGGGPAGLKAAESAAMRGHQVTLFERKKTLGGQVALAASAPGHAEWGEIVRHLEARVGQLGVEVRLGAEATPELIRAEGPEAVVLATGALPGAPPFATHPAANVIDEWQVLEGTLPRSGRVVLLDLGVRFEPGALVETLLERDNEVHWVAPTPTVGVEIEPASLIELMRRVADAKLERYPETMVVEAGERRVTVVNVFTGKTSRIGEVDAVVVIGNKVSNNSLERQLDGTVPALQVAGDCVAPRQTTMAIYEGELAGRAV